MVMEGVGGGKLGALVTSHRLILVTVRKCHHVDGVGQPGTSNRGLGRLGTQEAAGPQRVWPSLEASASQPVSVCKLPRIVPLPFRSFQFCVPSQLKIRFCLHTGQRPWDPPEKICSGNRTQSGPRWQERQLSSKGLEAWNGEWHFPCVFMFSWGLINSRQTSL